MSKSVKNVDFIKTKVSELFKNGQKKCPKIDSQNTSYLEKFLSR